MVVIRLKDLKLRPLRFDYELFGNGLIRQVYTIYHLFQHDVLNT